MNENMTKKVTLRVGGMTCTSCEVLVERKLKHVPGVKNVSVNRAKETADIEYEGSVQLEQLQEAVKSDRYSIMPVHHQPAPEKQSMVQPQKSPKRTVPEIAAVAILIFGLYLLFKQFNLLPDIGITDNMSYGIIFLIGLIAATSTCLAVAGGLLLTIANKYNEVNPHLTGMQKFTPHIYFNIGRVASYTILGGLIGLLGSVLTPSARITGMVIVAASVLMIIVGIQLLHIFPFLERITPKMPKFIAHRIYDASTQPKKSATYAFLFGGSTFFLPCGFTQALQLYVLAKGSFTIGALTMLAFSLGTLPSLVGIGALSSFAKYNVQRHFTTFSAVLIIVLGIFNIPNGLALTGISTPQLVAPTASDTNVVLVDGKQIIELKVDYLDYEPNSFTVMQGIPVEWKIDGRNAQGCAQVISAPDLGITEFLPKNEIKTIQFTPSKVGKIKFSCSMGMAGPGVINVIPNTKGSQVQGTVSQPEDNSPSIQNGEVQKLQLEISREKGFYPNSFTVKKGIPVELDIDAKIQMGGCMSMLIIPNYNVAQRLTLGQSTLRFTPTETGTVYGTCSMGSRLITFNVVEAT